jgi:hypothetical protein
MHTRTMSTELRFAGGIFKEIQVDLYGAEVDTTGLRAHEHPAHLWEFAGKVWQQRLETEYRSVQIMVRLLDDMMGAGDPIDTFAGVANMISDEIHHVGLCASIVKGLGATPTLPNPVAMESPEAYLKQPRMQRALSTAVAMLAVNETISEGYITDLHARCQHPVVHEVLDRTLGDEETHNSFGWTYIEKSIKRFPEDIMKGLQTLVQQSLLPHKNHAETIISKLSFNERSLSAWPDEEHVPLGLFTTERQALVYQQTFEERLEPQLKKLNLL